MRSIASASWSRSTRTRSCSSHIRSSASNAFKASTRSVSFAEASCRRSCLNAASSISRRASFRSSPDSNGSSACFLAVSAASSAADVASLTSARRRAASPDFASSEKAAAIRPSSSSAGFVVNDVLPGWPLSAS